MNDAIELIDRALHLGEQIAEAAEAEAWERLPTLVEQRAEVAQQLATRQPAPQQQAPSGQRLQALADQHERLGALLRERRTQVEGELAELGQLRSARDSYGASSPRPGVLNARLAG